MITTFKAFLSIAGSIPLSLVAQMLYFQERLWKSLWNSHIKDQLLGLTCKECQSTLGDYHLAWSRPQIYIPAISKSQCLLDNTRSFPTLLPLFIMFLVPAVTSLSKARNPERVGRLTLFRILQMESTPYLRIRSWQSGFASDFIEKNRDVIGGVIVQWDWFLK